MDRAHDRMKRVFDRLGITREMVQARVDQNHLGGRLPTIRLYDWQYGCSTTAAMLELVEEMACAATDAR